MKSKITVFHHSADFDGLFCREIAHHFLPDAELIGWDFKDPPVVAPTDGQIYVMDIPVDRLFGEKFPLHESLMSRIIWIDHHKSSIETHPTDLKGYRIDGVAACRLAWAWFLCCDGNWYAPRSSAMAPAGVLPMIQDFKNRDVEEPLAVRLAGEYDVWDKRDPRAELFQHGLRSCDLSSYWPNLLRDDEETVANLLERGEALQYAREQEYAEVIQQQGFTVEFEGLKFLACNSHELDIRSHLFAAGIKPEHDALMGFTFNGKDWRVSLYHAPGKEHHDLSVIAKKYDGGGHRGACGYRAVTLPFIPK